MTPAADLVPVTLTVLSDHPLPDHGSSSSKGLRGCLVVAGGTIETPGAPLLAGLGAQRAGAGTVQLVVPAPTAVPLGVAFPESRVVGVEAGKAAQVLGPVVEQADAVLVGTGTFGTDDVAATLRAVVDALAGSEATLLLDAGALKVLGADPDLLQGLGGRTVLMPNPSETADLLGVDVPEVEADPRAALERVVERFGCTVSYRAPDTLMAGPGTDVHLDTSGNTGLAMSGSGDVLAGLIGGYLARGADPLTALLWATRVHGEAADRCAARHGAIGFLAREVLDEVVPAARTLHRRTARRRLATTRPADGPSGRGS